MNPGTDPAREKVERADQVLREFQQSVIDDPTVFAKGAGLGLLVVIELARLARSGSQDPAVQGFADGLRRRREVLRRELVSVAGRKGLDVPTGLVHEDEKMLDEAPLDPAAFDAWFTRQVRREHFKAIALFEAATSMKDADLAAFATSSLETLRAERDDMDLLPGG